MDINEEQLRRQWNEAIARMAVQLDAFKARIDSESQLLCTKLSAEIASLQSDLTNLDVEALSAGSDPYARRIATLLERLRAQGEAAYVLLQSTLPPHIDPTDVEIRRLEALAALASGDERAGIISRLDELRATQAAGQAQKQVESSSEQPS